MSEKEVKGGGTFKAENFIEEDDIEGGFGESVSGWGDNEEGGDDDDEPSGSTPAGSSPQPAGTGSTPQTSSPSTQSLTAQMKDITNKYKEVEEPTVQQPQTEVDIVAISKKYIGIMSMGTTESKRKRMLSSIEYNGESEYANEILGYYDLGDSQEPSVTSVTDSQPVQEVTSVTESQPVEVTEPSVTDSQPVTPVTDPQTVTEPTFPIDSTTTRTNFASLIEGIEQPSRLMLLCAKYEHIYHNENLSSSDKRAQVIAAMLDNREDEHLRGVITAYGLHTQEDR